MPKIPKVGSVFLQKPMRKNGNLNYLIYQEIPGVEVYQARKVYVESDVPLPFHGDAEIIFRTPLSLEVVPKALKVIVPLKGVSSNSFS